jgi:hypothetical protein
MEQISEPKICEKCGESKTIVCTKCGEKKILCEENFGLRNIKGRKYFRTHCKSCRKEYSKTYRETNPDKISSYGKEYYQENKTEIILYSKKYKQANKDTIVIHNKEYYELNKDKILADKKEYREANRDTILASKKEYRKANKDKIAAHDKQYYENNKDKVLTQRKEYYQSNKNKINAQIMKRYYTDPAYRIRRAVSVMVGQALKNTNSSKNGESSWEYLPYTPQDLKNHIEQLFSHPDNLTPDGKVWMTWKNWGKYDPKKWDDNDPTTWVWNLDHITPHSSFNYTLMTDENCKRAWALENLRPLSAKQNIEDNDSRTEEQIKMAQANIAAFLAKAANKKSGE